jgi:hypothetical protein
VEIAGDPAAEIREVAAGGEAEAELPEDEGDDC